MNVLNSIFYNKQHNNKNEIYNEIESISKNLTQKGYINNEYNIKRKKDLYTCTFILNKRIKKIRINIAQNSLDKNLLEELSENFSNNFFETTTEKLESNLTQIKDFYTKQGNTFIKVSLNNIKLRNNILTAKLKIDNTYKRKIDKIIIKGYDEFPLKIIKNKLHFNKRTIFNKTELDHITEKLNSIPYLFQSKKPEVLFKKDSTILYVYLKKKTENQFDGLIGFSNKEDSKNINLTGYINLNLSNTFNRGENISLNWRSSDGKKRSLVLIYKAPYIFKSKLGFEGEFNLQRNDSTYTNRNTTINFNYNYLKNQSIGGIVNFESSNTTLNNDEFNLKNYSKNLFGISYSFEHSKTTNNFLFIKLNYLTGTRSSNSDQVKQDKFQFHTSYKTKLGAKSKISIKNNIEILTSKKLFQNELFQIGGFNSIRGFDEQSILTSNYNITNIEYQLFVNSSNYLFTVSDFGFINNNSNEPLKNLTSIGLGYNFRQKNTNFNISYVLGKTNLDSFQFSNAKFHIKMSYFF